MLDITGASAAAGSAPGAGVGIGGPAGPSRDQFLRLLIHQLKHQDPLNPLSDQNFTAQLAQFSSLEQLAQINENLLGLGGIQQDLVNAQALNLLGRRVLVSAGAGMRVQGGQADAVVVDAPDSAVTLSVQVKDSSGRTVRTIEVPPGSGRRTVEWDGKDDQGQPLADGTYTLEADARDAQGSVVDASLFLALTIDGVAFTPDGVRLGSAGRTVGFDQIIEIQTL